MLARILAASFVAAVVPIAGVVTQNGAPAIDTSIARSRLGREFPALRTTRAAWRVPPGNRAPERVPDTRPTLVVVSARDASGCAALMEELEEVHDRFESDGLSIVLILGWLETAESDGALAPLLREHDVRFCVLDDRDNENASRLRLMGYPSAFLLHADGTVVLEGPYRPGDAARFDRQIRRLLRPVPKRDLDYDAHITKLQEKLPHDDFHIVVEPPFVVVGDETEATVRRRAAGTVRWAVNLLKEGYFDTDPDHIIDVWLFKDRPSYNKHTFELFRQRPFTRYGFYSAHHKALIMNIETGGGTLCHEIVHPYVRANFPECPAWLNEGLGSLYEQCRERDGKITGMTNWRLPILQRAIGKGKTSTFERLCATTDDEFYSEDKGVHYAQARYLCYYLQEQGLMRGYFKAFVANRAEDESGYETLRRVLRRPDMTAFQREWETFVRGLRR